MTTLVMGYYSRCNFARRTPKFRKALGLIEIAMSLGISALIIAAALSYYSNANESRRVKDVLSQAMAIDTVVHSLFAGQSSLDGLDTATVAQSGQMQKSYVTPDGLGLTNAFKGPVYVYNPPGFPGFDMLFQGLSRTGCQQIALAAYQMGGSIIQIVINPPAGIPSAGGFGSYGLEPAVWSAATRQYCDKPGNGNTVRFSTSN